MLAEIATWLYVPGDRLSELLPKAARTADGIVIDLEDAVHPAARPGVRALLPAAVAALAGETDNAVSEPRQVPVVVRVNPVGSADFETDLAAVGPLLADGRVHGIRLPKVESPTDVKKAYAASSRFLDQPHLVPLIESALGLLHAAEIAAETGVHSLTLGESDLRADLGLPRDGSEDGLLLARLTVVQAARAAGLPSPVASVHPHVTDLDGLRRSCETLRQLGFYGRSVIHPRQVPVVRDAFAPRADELQWADEVLARVATMDRSRSAAATLDDGSFVDPAILRQARLIHERANA
ncbi:CoA ester lyase [Terrabacter aerolatus]|uniref:CoA ester lyase n=1 Tax=Terrabacter aerolatus TaxID=422442 RepID=A0A512D755_9MICO|nr:aldolase/citrate lyase family protein [Terrabacter aerolatus]GEO32207.1 CoA ester lyase [Terrabacter aerolatus]